jgi:hypothetical protein
VSLDVLQDLLGAALRRRPEEALDPSTEEALAGVAVGSPSLPPMAQIGIYREQFWLRHRDVLREDFRSLVHALGETAFDELATAYLVAHPPATYTLRDVGASMAAFLARDPWAADPLLVDLARVEWAFVEAFDAADAPGFNPAVVQGVADDAWPLARIVFCPSLRSLGLASGALDYRIAVHEGRHPARPERNVPEHVVVYRGPERLHGCRVSAAAADLIDALKREVPLGAACEGVATSSGIEIGAFRVELAEWFARWTSLGWISNVDFTSPPRPSP